MSHYFRRLVNARILVGARKLVVRPPATEQLESYPAQNHDAHADAHKEQGVVPALVLRRRLVVNNNAPISLLDNPGASGIHVAPGTERRSRLIESIGEHMVSVWSPVQYRSSSGWIPA